VEEARSLAERLGLPVQDTDLIGQALVHSSWHHEHPDAVRGNNERLEFLGDSVVNLAISEALFARHPGDDEGVLSARRATIVSTPGLARLAARIDLGSALLLGEGESQRGGRRRPSLLASSFEALAGALYLDLGWERVRAWIVELATPELSLEGPLGALKSPKSRLQELTQRSIGSRPDYRVVDATGPDHDRLFRIEAVVDGAVLGLGTGPSRRAAETAAATEALEHLRARSLPEAGDETSRDAPPVEPPVAAEGTLASDATDVPIEPPHAGSLDRSGTGDGPAETDPGRGRSRRRVLPATSLDAAVGRRGRP
jgi:ribonuclease-3